MNSILYMIINIKKTEIFSWVKSTSEFFQSPLILFPLKIYLLSEGFIIFLDCLKCFELGKTLIRFA